jgi:hypothetical protein
MHKVSCPPKEASLDDEDVLKNTNQLSRKVPTHIGVGWAPAHCMQNIAVSAAVDVISMI